MMSPASRAEFRRLVSKTGSGGGAGTGAAATGGTDALVAGVEMVAGAATGVCGAGTATVAAFVEVSTAGAVTGAELVVEVATSLVCTTACAAGAGLATRARTLTAGSKTPTSI